MSTKTQMRQAKMWVKGVGTEGMCKARMERMGTKTMPLNVARCLRAAP